jgi:four helix bundle protein
MYHSFEDLEVWKRSCQLAVNVYAVLRDSRDYTLRDQMQRSALSIPSNIAEGSERGGRDFERFLRIAQGSAAELRTQTYIAMKIGVIPAQKYSLLIAELKETSKMLRGLRRYIRDSQPSQPKRPPRTPRPKTPPRPQSKNCPPPSEN